MMQAILASILTLSRAMPTLREDSSHNHFPCRKLHAGCVFFMEISADMEVQGSYRMLCHAL